MTRHVTASNTSNHERQSHGANFSKVLDGRKQPIRGLWVRNGRYYAQLKVEDLKTGQRKTRRIVLADKEGAPVTTVAGARAAMEHLHEQRRSSTLPMLRQHPKLVDYVEEYLAAIKSGNGEKKPGTIAKEESTLRNWIKQLGGYRLDQIKRYHIHEFMQARLQDGMCARTVNLDLVALRNVLKRAFHEQRIMRLPTEGMRPLKTTTTKRPFFNHADLSKLCQAAFLTKTRRNKKGEQEQVPLTRNAQEFVDYVRLLAYSGARRNEALALTWQDVDFQSEQLTIGSSGDTKNRRARIVDFNPKLKTHLLDMRRRRAPDSQWLFPSPQRGAKDIPLKTLRESLELVRNKAGLPHFQFHDCRHHFISLCVMSGIDFMTIAAWVGHLDGGILIGKVYGHLANEHRKRMAQKVSFEPEIVGSTSQEAAWAK